MDILAEMFSRSVGKVSESVNLLGKGTFLTGEISIEGDFRLDGKLEGNVIVKGRLVLGPEGVIHGNVTAEFADISGEIKGDVLIRKILHLKNTCRLEGDVECQYLVVDSGAVFNGVCRMGAKMKRLVEQIPEEKPMYESR